MALLSKEQILEAPDRDSKEVDVPEWGGSVRLQAMSGTDRDRFESWVGSIGDNDMAGLRGFYLSLCIVDDNGERLFDADDVEALGKKSAKALDRLFNEAQTLNRVEAEAVEELEKN